MKIQNRTMKGFNKIKRLVRILNLDKAKEINF